MSQLVSSSMSQLDSWTVLHQCFCSAMVDSQQPIFPIGVLFLKLPPPPGAGIYIYIPVVKGSLDERLASYAVLKMRENIEA